MASFVPNAKRQTSLMLTAIGQRRWMMTVCICFLLLAGGCSARSQFEEHQSCKKTELVFYAHEDRVPPGQTMIISASPSANDIVEFGTIIVVDFVLREGAANDSTQLGRARGIVTVEKDLSFVSASTFELTIPGCSGSLTFQGTSPAQGDGELAITGGTGTYRFALGYLETTAISTDPEDVVVKNTVHLKYL